MGREIGTRLPNTMPNLAFGWSVACMPGEQLSFLFRFSATNEQCIRLYMQDSGQLIETGDINTHFGNVRSYILPMNAGQSSFVIAVFAFHKRTPPNARKPWYISEPRELDGANDLKVIGFEDSGGDGDYNDAVVEIRFESGQI